MRKRKLEEEREELHDWSASTQVSGVETKQQPLNPTISEAHLTFHETSNFKLDRNYNYANFTPRLVFHTPTNILISHPLKILYNNSGRVMTGVNTFFQGFQPVHGILVVFFARLL